MKGEELLNAMGDIDDRYIEEAVIQEAVRPETGDGRAKKEAARRVETVGKASGDNKTQHTFRLIWYGSAAAAVLAAVLSVTAVRLIRRGETPADVKNETAMEQEDAVLPDQEAVMENEQQGLYEENAGAGAAVDEAGEPGEAEALIFGTAEEREYITCTTLEDAERLAGFEMDAPDEFDGNTLTTIRCYGNEMLELIYRDGTGKETIRIRKASLQEILDEYGGDYEVDETSASGEIQVRFRGTFEGIDVVTWTDGGFFFSIDTNGTALSREEAGSLAALIR